MAEQSEEHFSEAFSLYHAALDEWQDVGSKLMLRVPPETTAEEDDHYSRRRAIAFIHGKALRVAREVYVLTIHGFGWAALARWRTLHELAVCAHLIGSEDESLGARFLDHVEIGSLELAVAQRQVAQELGGADVEDAELERLQQRKLELIREHGDGFEGRWGWARPLVNGKLNFEVLEDRTPFKHLRGIYKAASTEIHASPQSVTSNARRVDGNQHITTGPSPDQLGAGMNWSLASVQAISTLLVMEGGKYGDLMDQVRVEAGARVAADCRRLLHETLQQLDEWRRIRDESSP